MKSFFKITTILILLFFLHPLKAQEEKKDDLQREFLWGINTNTNSGLIGALVFKYSWPASANTHHGIGVELANIKHPKEVRYIALYTGNTFIWGKQFYLFAIRPQYYRDIVLFEKSPQQGVRIKAIFGGGPTLGLQSPYYIQYSHNAGISAITEPYDPSVHVNRENIWGSGGIAGVFQGIGGANLKIGAHIKSGLSFDFGTFKSSMSGFEIGFMLEAYTQKVVIIPTAENRALFPSAYFTLFYGSRK